MLLPLLALIAASGCEKTNDVPRLQDEALAMAKGYQERFDELAHRAEAINPASLGTTEVQRAYQQARSTLDRYRNDLRQVPIQAQAGVTNGNPDELRKLIDSKRAWFEGGMMEAISEITAVESWLGMARQRRMTPQAPQAPEPDTEDSLPVAPGSDALIR